MCRFSQINLLDEGQVAMVGQVDAIFCKNVLIYFGDEAAERAVQLMLRGLAEGGVLMVAKSEVPRVRALGHRAEELAPGVTVFRS